MRRYGIIIFLLLSVLVFTFQSNSQDDRDIPKPYERSDNRFWGKIFSKLFQRGTFNKSYAIVIGLSDYSGEWAPLESPYYDALKVRDYLIDKAGFDYVVTLTNREATKDAINKYMEETLPDMIGDKDRFLFYYSGHGTQRELGDRVRGYLPTLDSGKQTWGDMISMDDIERWDENVHKAKQVLFVLDSCFSGAAGVQTKGKGQKLYLDDLSKYGHHLITAGTKDQESYGSMKRWDGSLFTWAFINGLSGKADAGSKEYPLDGVVSLTELSEYVKKKIKDEAAEDKSVNQSPQIHRLGDSEGEFFFIAEETRLKSLDTEGEKVIEHGWAVEVKGREMVLIPAGEFQMGSNDGEDDEKPVHKVYLDAFYMDKYEVTNAQYRRFVQATGHSEPEGRAYVDGEKRSDFRPWSDSRFNGDSQPVVCVGWDDAQAYAKWAGKRLPTEAEWEKAARGGLTDEKYPRGDSITHDDANYSGTSGKDVWSETAPVGSFDPNGYGLYDMAGNVWEWCADGYYSSYYSMSPERNPTGPNTGFVRVLRGGSWYYNLYAPFYLRVAYRYFNIPSYSYYGVGFRCVSQDSNVTP